MRPGAARDRGCARCALPPLGRGPVPTKPPAKPKQSGKSLVGGTPRFIEAAGAGRGPAACGPARGGRARGSASASRRPACK